MYSIIRPPVLANNFELKTNFIQIVQQMCQFDVFQGKDRYEHSNNYLEIYDTFMVSNVSEFVVRLRLFPFFVQENAKQWLSSLPQGSITTWKQLAEKFLAHYFLLAKITKLRSDISSFRQMESESLYDTWDRYKELLRKCRQHRIVEWMQILIFGNGLNSTTK